MGKKRKEESSSDSGSSSEDENMVRLRSCAVSFEQVSAEQASLASKAKAKDAERTAAAAANAASRGVRGAHAIALEAAEAAAAAAAAAAPAGGSASSSVIDRANTNPSGPPPLEPFQIKIAAMLEARLERTLEPLMIATAPAPAASGGAVSTPAGAGNGSDSSDSDSSSSDGGSSSSSDSGNGSDSSISSGEAVRVKAARAGTVDGAKKKKAAHSLPPGPAPADAAAVAGDGDTLLAGVRLFRRVAKGAPLIIRAPPPDAVAAPPLRLPGSRACERILGQTRYAPPVGKLAATLPSLAAQGDAFAAAADGVLARQAALPSLATKRVVGLPNHGVPAQATIEHAAAAGASGSGDEGGDGGDAGTASAKKKKIRKKKARYEGTVEEEDMREMVPHEQRMKALTGRG